MSFLTAAGVRSCLSALALSAIVASPAEAMNVSPMVIELASAGTRSTARIQVINVLKQDLPYEVRIYRVDFKENGELSEKPADTDFVVFPPQGILKFNQRQFVRLQWVGGAMDSSRAYYASIDQLPVVLDPSKINKKKASVDVQLVYHLKVLVTVAPPGAAARVSVESAKPAMVPVGTASDSSSGKTKAQTVPGLSVTVRNSGKRYAMLASANWTIQGKDVDNKPLRIVLTSAQMGRILGAGYLPALTGRRTFQVPTGARFGNSPISIKFSD